jgi:hypothetical protein
MTKRCRYCAEEIQAAAVLCRFCGREQTVIEKPSGSAGWVHALGIMLMIAFVGLAAVGIVTEYAAKGAAAAGTDTTATFFAPPAPPPPPPPLVVSVADEPYRHLDAGGSVSYWFELDDNRSCRLVGHLDVTQGGSRDVDVYVLDSDGYQNFENGNAAGTYLNEHRTSAVTFDLPVSGFKKYYLVVSNQFSVFTGKTVALENVHGICE